VKQLLDGSASVTFRIPTLKERLYGSFTTDSSGDLRRGQVVELIPDEETPCPERCSVVWVGKAGSKQEGEVGLETV
jgi:hypothetical protein